VRGWDGKPDSKIPSWSELQSDIESEIDDLLTLLDTPEQAQLSAIMDTAFKGEGTIHELLPCYEGLIHSDFMLELLANSPMIIGNKELTNFELDIYPYSEVKVTTVNTDRGPKKQISRNFSDDKFWQYASCNSLTNTGWIQLYLQHWFYVKDKPPGEQYNGYYLPSMSIFGATKDWFKPQDKMVKSPVYNDLVAPLPKKTTVQCNQFCLNYRDINDIKEPERWTLKPSFGLWEQASTPRLHWAAHKDQSVPEEQYYSILPSGFRFLFTDSGNYWSIKKEGFLHRVFGLG
jgi:hypothetical protein